MRWFVPTAPADDLKAVIDARGTPRPRAVTTSSRMDASSCCGSPAGACGSAGRTPPAGRSSCRRARQQLASACVPVPAPPCSGSPRRRSSTGRERLGAVASERIESSLDDQVSAAGDGRARRRVLEEFVRRRAHDAAAEPMIVAAALLGRAQHPIGTLARVADEFGVSSRHSAAASPTPSATARRTTPASPASSASCASPPVAAVPVSPSSPPQPGTPTRLTSAATAATSPG